jgi:hypothetical protein
MRNSCKHYFFRILLFIILFLIGFIFVQYFMKHNKEPLLKHYPNMHVVVARYEEDLSWINIEIPSSLYSTLYIYNKGSKSEFDVAKQKIITLPNIGREGHTYLSHVVNYYDKLPEMVLFVPGSTGTNEGKKKYLRLLIEHLKKKNTSAIVGFKDDNTIKEANNFSIDFYEVTSYENKKKNPQSHVEPSDERPLHKWFHKHFGEEKVNCVSYLGLILVSREDILKRPKEFYKKLRDELSHPNPETGHYTERTWKHIFSIDNDNCLEH